jgi:predicted  nucleic acid-binding Zn-ribbon protein
VDEELEDVQAERNELRAQLAQMTSDLDDMRDERNALQSRIEDAVRTLEHG